MEDRKRRQIELAKMFYEMGMEEDLVCKIAGIEKDELNKHIFVDKDDTHKYNNRANEK